MTWRQKPYPSKTTLNLMMKEKSPYPPSRLVAGLAAVILLILLLTKFAVVDRLNAAAQAERDAADAQQRLSSLQRETTAYDAVRTEYARYFSAQLTASSEAPATCMEVLALMESCLLPDAGISSLDFSGTVIQVQLTGTDLSRASGILARLYQSPLVSSVDIYTADAGGRNESASGTSVNMTITLQSTQAAEGGDAP